MSRCKNIAGLHFGLLEALYRIEPHITPSGQVVTMWMCKCQCGTYKAVRYQSLVSGDTTSCGCAQKSLASQKNSTHRESNTRLYEIWCGMKKRCYNPKSESYYCYGGKGVIVCDEWKDDYVAFRDWSLTNGYRDGLTIDHIDSSGNYEPQNCRWATIAEQANNKISWNHLLTLGDETHNITEWATILGVRATTLFKRKAAGWSDERTLTEPIHSCKRRLANT